MNNILNLIYPPEQIWIKKFTFDDQKRSIDTICKIPPASYLLNPIPYVTAENYVRCLSQACYLLAEHLVEKKLVQTDISADEFRKFAVNYELYYRNLNLIFHQRVASGESFPMIFTLKNWQEIKRLAKDFILFTFANQRTVISGETRFISVVG